MVFYSVHLNHHFSEAMLTVSTRERTVLKNSMPQTCFVHSALNFQQTSSPIKALRSLDQPKCHNTDQYRPKRSNKHNKNKRIILNIFTLPPMETPSGSEAEGNKNILNETLKSLVSSRLNLGGLPSSVSELPLHRASRRYRPQCSCSKGIDTWSLGVRRNYVYVM